jgi:hypothetical protein
LEGRELKEYIITGKMLHPSKDRKGYLSVRLYGAGKKMDIKVHRLVAVSFIPNPDNLPQINHKDENKENNSVNNLEWCDCYYNMHYGSRIAKTSKPICQYSRDGDLVARHPSMNEAARITGIQETNICAVAIGKRKSAGGFVWRYL